jgi:hypothetical protein
MTSTTRNLRQALGMAALVALALAGSLTPVRPANHQGTGIMTMKQDLADREKNIHWPEGFNRLWCKDRKQGIFDDPATLG